MLKKVTLHGRNGTRVLEIKPRGFGTRHIRTRVAPPPPSETPKPEPKQEFRPVPVCPVLASLHRLTTSYTGGNGFFVLDEIFVILRMENTSFSRDALLETLRSYYRDGQVKFRRGFGSQLQFALPKKERPA